MSRLRKNQNKNDLALLHRRISRHARKPVLADRQLILRSRGGTSFIKIPRVLQAAGLIAVGAFTAWVVHVSYAYIGYDKVVTAKDAAISARDQASLMLRSELDEARRSFADATDSLEKNHKGLVSLIGQNQTLKSNLETLRRDLAKLDGERKKAEAEKQSYAERLAILDRHLENTKRKNAALAQNLKNTGAELTVALAEKSQASRKGDSLNTRVGELKKRLSDAKVAQTALLERIGDTSQSEAKRLRSIIASAGLNIKKLLRAEGVSALAQGGPFEAASKSEAASDEEKLEVALVTVNGMLDHLDGLQRIVRNLPLASPLDYYYVSSRYGRRTDPINGTTAMHRGVDFGAKHRATVYSTAPGKVIYAGWKGKFGRFIEIDHGNGVITRYGHLRRIYVKRGQEIRYRTKIGQMGNSGRSTGTHLHYEIHVNKRSVDPLKIMKAGKNVFKG
jgi:murein DD-endopeptidase MepM/ murein hydrolase activator NlpD